MFGIGYQEILILVLGALCFALSVAGLVAVIGLVMRPKEGDVADRLATLEAENRRLREEIERLKKPQP